jgi:hypothetical protein
VLRTDRVACLQSCPNPAAGSSVAATIVETPPAQLFITVTAHVIKQIVLTGRVFLIIAKVAKVDGSTLLVHRVVLRLEPCLFMRAVIVLGCVLVGSLGVLELSVALQTLLVKSVPGEKEARLFSVAFSRCLFGQEALFHHQELLQSRRRHELCLHLDFHSSFYVLG